MIACASTNSNNLLWCDLHCLARQRIARASPCASSTEECAFHFALALIACLKCLWLIGKRLGTPMRVFSTGSPSEGKRRT